jgi:hypothetical protein
LNAPGIDTNGTCQANTAVTCPPRAAAWSTDQRSAALLCGEPSTPTTIR